MGDGVDETVVLLVAPNLTHQKNRVEDDAGDDGTEEDDTEEDLHALAPVEDDPAASDSHRQRGQTHA